MVIHYSGTGWARLE